MYEIRFYDSKKLRVGVIHFLNRKSYVACLRYFDFSIRYQPYKWGVYYV